MKGIGALCNMALCNDICVLGCLPCLACGAGPSRHDVLVPFVMLHWSFCTEMDLVYIVLCCAVLSVCLCYSLKAAPQIFLT